MSVLYVVGILPSNPRGNQYILVMLDYFTKAIEAEAIESHFLQQGHQHGVPGIIRTAMLYLRNKRSNITSGHAQEKVTVEITNN